MFHSDLNFLLTDIANTNRSIDRCIYNKLREIEDAILVAALITSKTTKPEETLEKAYEQVRQLRLKNRHW